MPGIPQQTSKTKTLRQTRLVLSCSVRTICSDLLKSSLELVPVPETTCRLVQSVGYTIGVPKIVQYDLHTRFAGKNWADQKTAEDHQTPSSVSLLRRLGWGRFSSELLKLFPARLS
ncbi:hypothetical protein Bbelb_122540 [Branchiostoma belcheri]|nr:hypothetical protein Bbelb_122540 [Branchiostoma belcheri]